VTELRPSDLRHRLTLEELSRVADEGGGFTESWITVATIFADPRPISGEERFEADRLAGSITHEVVLRYRAGVVPAMRLRKGARIFQILAVIDVEERRRWLKCWCEERELRGLLWRYAASMHCESDSLRSGRSKTLGRRCAPRPRRWPMQRAKDYASEIQRVGWHSPSKSWS
jgi:SPP1 family predicted phage head-tail adaptor